ncbi:hypothetical protein [Ruminococcus difficilis]|uniref:DUF5050 domain-containing protein n=1 Tax=Ruminococcus difficilis TaxID=2763069 RepID=A0A935C2D1_9FIRM|nr:hypothetical protein [Ruminococcus difficilis]MBK6089160.1 hypothetical protein [Ruminococcus difficilis]
MKRRLSVLFLVIMLFAGVLCGCAQRGRSYELPETEFEGTDYYQNNSMVNSSDFLMKIGDKLYTIASGYEVNNLCEISSDGVRIVYTEPMNIGESEIWYGNTLYVLDDMLCVPQIGYQDSNSRYSDRHVDLETGTIKEPTKIVLERSGFWYPCVCNGRLYIHNEKDVFRCDGDNKTTPIISKSDLPVGNINDVLFDPFENGYFGMYISEPYVYYGTTVGKTVYLCRYDCTKGKTVDKVKVADSVTSNPGLNNIIADGSDVYCSENATIYHIDLENDTCEALYTGEDGLRLMFNCGGGKLYLAENFDQKGVLYELDTQHPTSLRTLVEDSDLEFRSLYLFDDTYVYYNNNLESVLCRVRISDGKTEKVLDYRKYEDVQKAETTDTNPM